MLKLRSSAFVFLCFTACAVVSSSAQNQPQGQPMYTDLEAHVGGLPSLMARTSEGADVLATSLDIVIHDRSICCGRDSALEDSVERADPLSLKDVAAKLQGRHLLDDGRPISVTADFWPAESVDALRILTTLNGQHALLMAWNSHLHVVTGMIYRWVQYSADDAPYTVIRKLRLLDTRYSDSRREVEFNRDTDDPAKVQGFLTVTWTTQ